MSETEEAPPKPSRKKKRLIIFIMVLVLIAGALAVAAIALGGPSSGKINVGQAKQSANAYSIDLTPKPYTGSHMKFDYPRGMQPIASNELSSIDVEKASFKAKDLQTWDLNIDVYYTNGQPLSSDSSYKYRLENPDTYTASQSVINGQTVYIMANKTVGGFEKVAFFDHGGLRASVSLEGDDENGAAPLQTTFGMVLSSWRWL